MKTCAVCGKSLGHFKMIRHKLWESGGISYTDLDTYLIIFGLIVVFLVDIAVRFIREAFK